MTTPMTSTSVVSFEMIDSLLSSMLGEQFEAEKSREHCNFEILDKLEQLSTKKLYHEFTDASVEYLSLLPEGKRRLDFFHGVIGAEKDKLNPLRLAQLLQLACQNIGGESALKFMAVYEESIKSHDEATLFFKTAKACELTSCSRFKEAEALLDGVHAELSTQLGSDLALHANCHFAIAKLHQGQGKLDDFYKHAILYLNYSPAEAVKNPFQLAFDLSIAGILGEGTYDFGELLQLGVVVAMKDNAEQRWLHDLLVALSEGRWALYDEALRTHQKWIEQSPLNGQEEAMRRKITLLALKELAFRKPEKYRKLTFDEIASHCRIERKEVELCVMKAMSNNLLKGSIDEITGVVRLSWVKPRILDVPRLEIMAQRLDGWTKTADELLVHLEQLTPELLVS